MKSLPTQLLLFLRHRPSRRNVVLLLRFLGLLGLMIVAFSILFHFLMAMEGQRHSWLTGFYWTLTVMSTLGFGDITFHSDLGRAFSIVVLLSGIVFMLILLPFTLIQFFYAPWMEAQAAARAPRELPPETNGHVVLTRYDPVTAALIARLRQMGYDYVVLVPEQDEALRLHDMQVRVMIGDLDSPDTYRLCRATRAAMVVTTQSDPVNSNVAFTSQEVAPHVPIVATADAATAARVLRMAGCDHVLQLPELMGESLARRTIGGDAVSHVIGSLDPLLIAEANASRTPLVGKTIAENRLGDLGVTVVGVWERGVFKVANPDTMIGPTTVLVLAGTREQLDRYDEAFAIYNVSGEPVVLIGAGRVGRATARALADRGIECVVLEKDPAAAARAREARTVVGDAGDVEVLNQAGIDKAPAVLITTHDDAVNVYLTILLRNLRPDIQIVSRATLERNVSTLHRAGADFVISMASMGVGMVMNLLAQASLLTVAEGLNIVRVKMPPALAGRTLAETALRRDTGATILAVVHDGQVRVNPNPREPLPQAGDLLMVATSEAEAKVLEKYGTAGR